MKRSISLRQAAAVVTGALCLAVISPKAGSAANLIYADSEADFTTSQDSPTSDPTFGNWQYGYYANPSASDPSTTFNLKSYNSGYSAWTSVGGFLNETSGAPNGAPDEFWSVRRLDIKDSFSDALVDIELEFGDIRGQGDVLGQVLLNGVIVQTLTPPPVGETATALIRSLSVSGGDILDFAFDPNGEVENDSAVLTAVVSETQPVTAPTPALLPGLLGFGISLLKKRRSLSA